MAPSDAAAPPFPDCWIAYGATDAELRTYGGAPRLMTGPAWGVLVGQVAVLAVLGLVAVSEAPLWLRGIAAGAGIAVGISAVVSALRLVAMARALTPRREHLWVGRALGPAEAVPWEQIGEIGLAQLPTRQVVGLRLRSGSGGRLPTLLGALSRRVSSGFDFLLVPGDGDCDRLGRMLLRYCIDRQARGRLPARAA
jgi:hypothetical protein